MTTFEKSIQIAAAPDDVWICLIHPNWVQKWWTSLQEYHFASELQSGLGMKFVVEEKLGMGPLLKSEFEVTRWKKPEQIMFKMISGTGAESYEVSWTLEAVEGGTLFNYVENLTLSGGFMDKIWSKLGRHSSIERIEGYLHHLKALVELREAEAVRRRAA
jgi:uncharacterized protein YndB with AHSA1/START domain